MAVVSADTPTPAFDAAVRWVIDIAEGGASVISDSGGTTRFGISQKNYPDLDIAHLTRDQAEAIYLRDYWRPIAGDSLPQALALIVFDAAVNMGPATAVKMLQTVLRHVAVDGQMGPLTIQAARAYLPRAELVAQALELRLRWYQDIVGRDVPKYSPYLYGWRMRVLRLALEAGGWRGL